jgi:hypothetical protein
VVTVPLVEDNDNVTGTSVPYLVSYFVDVRNSMTTQAFESDVAFIDHYVEN